MLKITIIETKRKIILKSEYKQHMSKQAQKKMS